MKKLIVIIAVFLLTGKLYSQGQPFYYYQGEKIILKEQANNLLVKISEKSNKKRLLDLILTDPSVQIVSKEKTIEILGSFVVLESKTKSALTSTTVAKYVNSPDVVSALPMLEYKKNKLQGIFDEFIVKLKPSNSLEALQNLAKQYSCVIVKENEFVKNQFSLSVPKTARLNAMQLANLFYETGLFEFAEPNFFFFGVTQTTDPLFINQWPLKNTGQNSGTVGADIKIEQAWSITQGRPEVKIAVVDEGVDLDHPDLSANLLAGFDAVYGTSNGDATGDDAHGTACAGIIAAVKDNGIGISGVAPGCRVIPIRSMVNNNGTAQQFADGINWAWQNNADVISNSWMVMSPQSIITNAINDAVNYGRNGLGAVVLFGAGNFGEYSDATMYIEYPGNLPNVIGVGATNQTDNRSSFSEWGIGLDLVAPGGEGDANGVTQGIYTTDIAGPAGYSTSDYDISFIGTSAACPHAAGVAALILSVNRCLTWLQVKQILELGCDKVGPHCYTPNSLYHNGSWTDQMGHGRINAFNAVQYAYSCSVTNFTNVSNAIDNTAPDNNLTFPVTMTAGCAGVTPGLHYVQRHEVIKNITYPYTQAATIVGSSNGYSFAVNDGKYWMEAINVTPTSATLRTYVYENYSLMGFLGTWFPTDPANITFDYSVLSSLQNNIYLQNQSLYLESETKNSVDQINVGSNVTTAVPYGNYEVIGNSTITLHAGNAINLETGTFASPDPYDANGYFYAYVDPFFMCNTCSQYPQGRIIENNKLDETVSLFENYETTFQKQDLNGKKNQRKIYPIPFNDKLTIEYTIESSENVTVSICDLNGKELIQLKNRAPHEQGIYKIEFNGVNLPEGTYLVKIATESQVITEKIIKTQ